MRFVALMKMRNSHIDLYLLVAILGLLLFSMGAVYSASLAISGAKHGDSTLLFKGHAVRVVIGIIFLFVGLAVDYHVYMKLSKVILIIGVVFLVYTLIGGDVVKGAQRWVTIGPVQFQPSEYVKYSLIIHLSVLLASKYEYITDFRNGFMPIITWIGIVVLLIFLQPNFSTGMLIFALSVILLYVGRVRLKHLLVTLVGTIPGIIYYAVSAPYRWSRIAAYFTVGREYGTSSDTSSYQGMQAVIGMGSGGILGVGVGLSKQRELFLPESYTDFIFAIIGEEYGFIGTVIIVCAFTLIMIRGLRIAKHADDDLGRYLATGITSIITVYAIVNAMVTTGLLPTTGIPMPLISYGGSSILFTSYALGILLNISMGTKLRRIDANPNIADDYNYRAQK